MGTLLGCEEALVISGALSGPYESSSTIWHYFWKTLFSTLRACKRVQARLCSHLGLLLIPQGVTWTRPAL